MLALLRFVELAIGTEMKQRRGEDIVRDLAST